MMCSSEAKLREASSSQIPSSIFSGIMNVSECAGVGREENGGMKYKLNSNKWTLTDWTEPQKYQFPSRGCHENTNRLIDQLVLFHHPKKKI